MNTLSSAKEYSKNGKIDEWIQIFLRTNNAYFADLLKEKKRYYYGPVNMPLSLFKVVSGPAITYHRNDEIYWFYYVVDEMKKAYQRGWDMPPLIVQYKYEEFEIHDGAHRYLALQQLGINEYHAIIYMTEEHDYEEFIKKYNSTDIYF
jgi:hypothetical protein